MKKVFTTGDVAKHCCVAPRTAGKWFDSGKLKGYRIPGSQDRRIPRDEFKRFLKEQGMPLGELEEEELHKVLLIGLDQRARCYVHNTLGDSDAWRVEHVETAVRAGMMLTNLQPECVVIDFCIGRSSALEILKACREQGCAIAVALTGEDDVGSDLVELFDRVFQKPIQPALLVEAIKNLTLTKESM